MSFIKTLSLVAFLFILIPPGCKKNVGEKMDDKKRRKSGILVVVAAIPIKSGRSLDPSMVGDKFIPKEFYSSQMVKMADLKKHLGKSISRAMEKGETLFIRDLRSSDSQLVKKIRPGGRAFLLSFPGKTYEKLITPGTHLDLISVSMVNKDGQEEMASTTILENITAMRSYLECDKKDKCSTTLVLLLLPHESEQLSLALKIGTVDVTVRNPDDRGLIKMKRVTTISNFKSVKKSSPLERNVEILNQIKKLKIAPKPDKEVKDEKLKIKLREKR